MNPIPGISTWFVRRLFGTRYRLASWTRKHRRFGGLVRRMLFDEDDMVVIPKDTSLVDLDMDIEIDGAGERTVLPSDIVKDVIRRNDEIFIMNNCLCRKSNGCKDYPMDRGCIFLGKGIRKIPAKYGHRATADEAVRYIDECSEMGFVHIIGRNKLDSLWLGTGDKKDLMTICNCCPCCCLWNIVRDVSDDISSVYKRMDGVGISVDTEKCVGCGACEEICFTKAVSIVEGRSHIDIDRCRCCGRCVESCSFDAISISFDPDVVEGEVERISALLNHC